jgi:hypothetical protein
VTKVYKRVQKRGMKKNRKSITSKEEDVKIPAFKLVEPPVKAASANYKIFFLSIVLFAIGIILHQMGL